MLNTLSPSLPFCFSSLIISFISPTSFCLTIFIYITICIFIYITCFFPISLPQPTFLYTSLYISVSTSSFIHSFIQQTFNKHLPVCQAPYLPTLFSLPPPLSISFCLPSPSFPTFSLLTLSMAHLFPSPHFLLSALTPAPFLSVGGE